MRELAQLRLFRYAARPPLSMDRLEALPDGRLRYWFKTAWRNGTTHAIFEPLETWAALARVNMKHHTVTSPQSGKPRKWPPDTCGIAFERLILFRQFTLHGRIPHELRFELAAQFAALKILRQEPMRN